MEKKKNEKSRKRYRTIAFRCSDAEKAEMDKRIELSGLLKQDYLIRSSLFQQINVIGNPLLAERLSEALGDVLAELRRIESAAELDEETLAPLRTVAEMLSGVCEV